MKDNFRIELGQSTLNERLLRISRIIVGSILIFIAVVLIVSSFTLNLFSLIKTNHEIVFYE